MSKWIAVPLSLIAAAISIGPALAGDSDPWIVGKVLGDVRIDHKSGSEPARRDLTLVPSDTIRTGKNGRVVLTRGQESIMVSPSTTISLPDAARAGMSTIIQRSGSIILEVEKQNVQHFEVETPVLAAVVKGTRFEVRVGSDRAKVSVLRGQVQVADFKSGQIGLVTRGQAAAVAPGHVGLTLTGAGPKAPIQQGPPRHSAVQPSSRNAAPAAVKATAPNGKAAITRTGSGAIRITGALGPVSLDVSKATGGLARTEAAVSGSAPKPTVWSGGQPTTAAAATPSSQSNSVNSAAASNAASSGSKSSGSILTAIFGTAPSPAPTPSPSPAASAPSTDTGTSNPPAAVVVTTASNPAATTGSSTSGSPGSAAPPAVVVGSTAGSTGTGSPAPGDTGGSTSSNSPSKSASSNAGGTGNGNSENNSSDKNTGVNGSGNSANNSPTRNGGDKGITNVVGNLFGYHGVSAGNGGSKEGGSSPNRGNPKK